MRDHSSRIIVTAHWAIAIASALTGAWAIAHRFYDVAAINVLAVTILAVALSAHYRTCRR
jgi:hypothetical protein